MAEGQKEREINDGDDYGPTKCIVSDGLTQYFHTNKMVAPLEFLGVFHNKTGPNRKS